MEFKIDVDVFAGPMDLLLYLVKRHEVDITQVPLAKMIDWGADWVQRGMPSLGKDTHFSTRDGKY